jgi:hypothetical protein
MLETQKHSQGASRELNLQLEAQRRKVDADNFDVTVRELVRMSNEGELTRAPEYQRQFRWDEEQESKLVESIFLGLPVPAIYVATNRDGTWELIDGLQRVSTLIHYVADSPESLAAVGKGAPLELAGLAKLSFFNGMTFAALPTSLQLTFLKGPLRLTALSDKSDVDVRFDLFERLNTGGIALAPQQIRTCVFRGRFSELLRELASLEDFTQLVKLQEGNRDDGTREELVLKFFAYLEKRDQFQGRVKEFLNQYMRDLPPDHDYESRRQLFQEVVSKLRAVVRGPISPQSLVEAVLVGAAELIQGGARELSPVGDWLNDQELTRFSTKDTNTRSHLNGRIERARDLLSGAQPV